VEKPAVEYTSLGAMRYSTAANAQVVASTVGMWASERRCVVDQFGRMPLSLLLR
jgi:hypothetical protein